MSNWEATPKALAEVDRALTAPHVSAGDDTPARPLTLEEVIRGAALGGHTDLVRAGLARRTGVVPLGRALAAAADQGHLDIIRLLVLAGAPVAGTRATHRATKNGQVAALALLRELGAVFDTFARTEEDFQYKCAFCPELHVVRAGGSLWGLTPRLEVNECYVAAAAGQLEVLRQLHTWGVLVGENMLAAIAGGLRARRPSAVRLCVELGFPRADLDQLSSEFFVTDDLTWWLTLPDMKYMPTCREELAGIESRGLARLRPPGGDD